jgi:hypothetical protein
VQWLKTDDFVNTIVQNGKLNLNNNGAYAPRRLIRTSAERCGRTSIHSTTLCLVKLVMQTQRRSYRGYEIQITQVLVMWRAAIYPNSYLRAVDWTAKPIVAADAGIAEIEAERRIDAMLDGEIPQA